MKGMSEMNGDEGWKKSDVMCQADKGESRLSNRQDKEGNCRGGQDTRINGTREYLLPACSAYPCYPTIDGNDRRHRSNNRNTETSKPKQVGMNGMVWMNRE